MFFLLFINVTFVVKDPIFFAQEPEMRVHKNGDLDYRLPFGWLGHLFSEKFNKVALCNSYILEKMALGLLFPKFLVRTLNILIWHAKIFNA